MTADQTYWNQLKPFQQDMLTPDIQSCQERYLLKNDSNSLTKKQQFDNTKKRLEELLSISGLFRHFIESKAKSDPHFKSILTDIDNKSKKNKPKRKTEREEDAELLKDEENEDGENNLDSVDFQFRESPPFINGKLRPYQIQGLNWLISLHKNKLAGILADEMGLGKTLQTISFIGYLRYIEKISGPILIIAPKSTLNNWLREINKWTPEINAFVLQGDKEERAQMIKDKLLTCDFDIVIASYEIIIREKTYFKRFDWEYIAIDEAHRIKNEESLLSQVLREFTSRNRLLITGTPLQNNLHELWALLNFLLPDIFSSSQDFDDWFSSDTSEEDKDKIVKQLQTVLQPFLLRRIKNDVEKSLLPKKEINLYVGMSSMQKKWYRQILEKDIDAVNGDNGAKESKTRLLNIVMQLRKCANHPYLFDGAEPGPPYTTDEHLVFNSAKLKVLDKLLKKLREEGSRVLIFSQMSRLLDILEDYCFLRGYGYCRIDGSTDHEDRIRSIDEYNAPDSEKFLFLLTTRAGGLGINLTSADVVVLFDSDWNPQADLQAMDRAHRIGQKKQVKVFRFITDNSVEEKILERATQKLRLDQLVIQQNSGFSKSKKENKGETKDSLLSMIQHGAADVFKSNTEENTSTESSNRGTPRPDDDNDKLSAKDKANRDPDPDIDLEQLLSNSEDKTKSLNAKYESLGLDDLQKFNQESAYEWNGTDFKKQQVQKDIIDPLWMHPTTKRERKENYSIDNYYKDVLNPRKAPTPLQPRMPKPRAFNSHQLLNPQIKELYEKDRLWIAKKTAYVPTIDDAKATYGEDLPEEELKSKLEKLKVDVQKAEPLTEEEEKQKTQWEREGFGNWNKLEFRKFISLSGKYGRNSIQAIAYELAPGKTFEEVEAYARAFWEKYSMVEDHERYIKNIEVEEEKLRKIKYQQDILKDKISQYKNPFFDLKLTHPPSTNNKRIFSKEEDRFLLLTLNKYGFERSDIYEVIRDEIRDCPLFELDFFFQSRTPLEISRRIYTLLQCLEKEYVMSATKGFERKIEAVVDVKKETAVNKKVTKKASSSSAKGNNDKVIKNEDEKSIGVDETRNTPDEKSSPPDDRSISADSTVIIDESSPVKRPREEEEEEEEKGSTTVTEIAIHDDEMEGEPVSDEQSEKKEGITTEKEENSIDEEPELKKVKTD